MSASQKVQILTTLPRRSEVSPGCLSARITDRLILRPLKMTDLQQFYTMRSEPDMSQAFGVFDSEEESKAHLCYLLGENDDEEEDDSEDDDDGFLVMYGIFLKESDGKEGELIGQGGAEYDPGGWPYIKYGLKKAHRGKGLGGEFMRAFLSLWWGFPRDLITMSLRVDGWQLDNDSNISERVEEVLCAATLVTNIASQMVLRKAGFEKCIEDGEYIRWRIREGGNSPSL